VTDLLDDIATLDIAAVKQELEAFAATLDVTFNPEGECGFGRSCVGFTDGDNWLAYHPYAYPDFEQVKDPPGLQDPNLAPPAATPDAYHKHACLAVLAKGDPPDYEGAMRQLLAWVRNLRAHGEPETVWYRTGATGIQAIVSGTRQRAIRFKQGS
jgi:hypothetical protein